jgi:hypothetical protein
VSPESTNDGEVEESRSKKRGRFGNKRYFKV